MLTCYSALAHLLGTFSLKQTVSPQDAKTMVNLSPIARLEELGKEPHFTSAKSALNEILDLYQNFLEIKDDKEKLLARFSVPAELETLNQNAERFGMKMHEALNLIGKDTRFARLLMI